MEHEVTSKLAIEVSIHASCFFKAESRIISAASAEFSNAKVHNVVARSRGVGAGTGDRPGYPIPASDIVLQISSSCCAWTE